MTPNFSSLLQFLLRHSPGVLRIDVHRVEFTRNIALTLCLQCLTKLLGTCRESHLSNQIWSRFISNTPRPVYQRRPWYTRAGGGVYCLFWTRKRPKLKVRFGGSVFFRRFGSVRWKILTKPPNFLFKKWPEIEFFIIPRNCMDFNVNFSNFFHKVFR